MFQPGGMLDYVEQQMARQAKASYDTTVRQQQRPQLDDFSEATLCRAIESPRLLDRLLLLARVQPDQLSIVQHLTSHLPAASSVSSAADADSSADPHSFISEPARLQRVPAPFAVTSCVEWSLARAASLFRCLAGASMPRKVPQPPGAGAVVGPGVNINELAYRRLWSALYVTVEERLAQRDAREISTRRGDVVFNKYYFEPGYVDESGEYTYTKEESPSNCRLITRHRHLRRIAQYLNSPGYSDTVIQTPVEVATGAEHYPTRLVVIPYKTQVYLLHKFKATGPFPSAQSAFDAYADAIAQ